MPLISLVIAGYSQMTAVDNNICYVLSVLLNLYLC